MTDETDAATSAGENLARVAVQKLYSPRSRCFGCGPLNEHGLRLESFRREGQSGLRASFQPQPYHQAFEGMVNGGIVGALLDCHSNWTAAIALMDARRASAPPCTVTADFHVRLRRPTPLREGTLLTLEADVAELAGDRVVVDALLSAEGRTTASCRGTFVAVKEGHPAFQRW